MDVNTQDPLPAVHCGTMASAQLVDKLEYVPTLKGGGCVNGSHVKSNICGINSYPKFQNRLGISCLDTTKRSILI